MKLALEQFPSCGYRRLACALGENRKPIQRILQLKCWQERKRPQGLRPHAWSLPSVASRPDECWATDITHVWGGKNRLASLAVINDYCTCEIRGWGLSDNGSSKTAEAAAGARAAGVGPFAPSTGLFSAVATKRAQLRPMA